MYEERGDLRKALDLVYEGAYLALSRPPERAYTCTPVIDARKKRNAERADAPQGDEDAANDEGGGVTLFDEKKRKKGKAKQQSAKRLDAAELEELAKRKQAEVDNAWRRVQELEPLMREDDRMAETLWLTEAEKCIEAFRVARELFSTTKVCHAARFTVCRPDPCSGGDQLATTEAIRER